MNLRFLRILTVLLMGIFLLSGWKEAGAAEETEWVKILPEKINLHAGQAVPLTLLVKEKGERPRYVPRPEFRSENEDTAFVKEGKLYGNKPGKTAVTAIYNGIKDESMVDVKEKAGNYSDYHVQMNLPGDLSVGSYIKTPITIEAKTVRKKGFDGVSARIEKLEGPGDAVIAIDSSPKRALLNSGELLAAPEDLSPAYKQAIQTEIKFTKAGHYSFEVMITGEDGEFIARTAVSAEVKPSFQDLGVQIHKLMAMRGAFGKDENGRAVAYTVLAGRPAELAAVDIETETVKKVVPLPEAEAAWAVTVASDGKVYAGSTPNGSLYQYTPGDEEAVNLGKPVKNQTVIWDLVPGKDGKVYGGTYYDGHTFEYSPGKGFTDFGEMVPGEEYVRSVAYSETENALYAGVGAHAHLIKYDLNTGRKTDVLPQAYRKSISVYDLQAEGGKLFVKLEPDFKLVVLDEKTLEVDFEGPIQSRGVSPLTPDGRHVYYTADGILQEYSLDEKIAKPVEIGSQKVNVEGPAIGFGYADLNNGPFASDTLVGFSGNYEGKFFKFSKAQGALKITNLPLPPQSTNIYNIGGGPDGKIYSSGFIGGDLGIFNPLTGKTQQETGLGQAEGMTSVGSRMFFGIYPRARIFSYDTSLPWNRKTNLKELFNLHGENEQNRPVAMISLPERNEIFAGTIPDYGKIGGSLSSYSLTTGKVTINRNIVENQSIISLAEYNGMVYAGSSIFGGTGSDPVAKEAKLIGYDASSGSKLFETAPVPGKASIGALYADETGKLWGIAQDTLFLFDPASQKTVYRSSEFPNAGAMRIGTDLIKGSDGMLYGTLGKQFFKIDTASKKVTFLHDDASKIAADKLGNFYFIQGDELSNGTNIWRYTNTDPVIRVEALLLNKSALTMEKGRIMQLEAKVIPEFATNKKLTWSSSNSGTASVDQTGLVTAVSEGTAVITAVSEDGRVKASAEVQVE
ncbi:Ig-like domain-containing protein [Metabacillus sp. GX 13764]|uniref:Ig-like domain-containing protein n=1 Tax=Metabacillus kandeliae TaxID=2900151 RepID=UPI001E60A1E8|nr:Ig-like domain-containing protein [Metabacillus kandeliae]MCD7032965.1 Ig-like domain-containing protein [Metabacillus kandeliae]